MNKFARTVDSTDDGDGDGPSSGIDEGSDFDITVGLVELLEIVGDDVVPKALLELAGARVGDDCGLPSPSFESTTTLLLSPLLH